MRPEAAVVWFWFLLKARLGDEAPSTNLMENQEPMELTKNPKRDRAWRRGQYEKRRNWWYKKVLLEQEEADACGWEGCVVVGRTSVSRRDNPERIAGMLANTPQWCSNICCGRWRNRRNRGYFSSSYLWTRQEKRSHEDFLYQMSQIYTVTQVPKL